MIAYKGTYNYRCRGQLYQIGKTYTDPKGFSMCVCGIHFCLDMQDILRYYNYDPALKILEIEILGKSELSDTKGCTDKLRILREVPKQEWDVGLDFKFDERGNMLSYARKGSHTYVYELEYDERNNMITRTYPGGHVYRYEYDERNNQISMTYPDGYKYTYAYDERGNRIAATSQCGRTTTYEYDDRGFVIASTPPLGNRTRYVWDARGNMTDGRVIEHNYPEPLIETE